MYFSVVQDTFCFKYVTIRLLMQVFIYKGKEWLKLEVVMIWKSGIIDESRVRET